MQDLETHYALNVLQIITNVMRGSRKFCQKGVQL